MRAFNGASYCCIFFVLFLIVNSARGFKAHKDGCALYG